LVVKQSAKLAPVRVGGEFFAAPALPAHRRYEALLAYLLEGCSASEAAARFGYTQASLLSAARDFRSGQQQFFVTTRPGPKTAPARQAARGRVIELRLGGHSVDEIWTVLAEEGILLNRTGIAEILSEEGFPRLWPRPHAARGLPVQERPTPTCPNPTRTTRSSPSATIGKATTGRDPQLLVFDSKLTTQTELATLDDRGISWLTLRARTPKLTAHLRALPANAWTSITLDRSGATSRHVHVIEDNDATLSYYPRTVRQLAITGLGHDEPTILITNNRTGTIKSLVERCAGRMSDINRIRSGRCGSPTRGSGWLGGGRLGGGRVCRCGG
jgi:hypothetical protein